MHLTHTPVSQDPVPVEHVELVSAGARAPDSAAARHVDVDGLVDGFVVGVGCPCLSHRRNFVVWTRRMKRTSLLVGRPRYYRPAHMDEKCLFIEETCMN